MGLYRLRGPNSTVVDGATKVLLSAHTMAHDPEAVRLVHDCLREVGHPIRRASYVLREAGSPTLAEVLGPRIEQWRAAGR